MVQVRTCADSRAMKITVSKLKTICPELDENLAREHIERLGEEYFQTFPPEEICRHISALQSLSPRNPVAVVARELAAEEEPEDLLEITVLAFDYPGLFSLITGVLAAAGFSIRTGDIFTYRAASEAARGTGRRRAAQRYGRRRIVDRFAGVMLVEEDPEIWLERVRGDLKRVLTLLEEKDGRGAAEAKHIVNELVAERLGSAPVDERRILYPVHLEVDNDRGPFTVLRVVGQDTPGFLYALSAALDLQGITIEHVRIRTVGRRVEDELHVLARGRKIESEEALDRLKLTVLLTKQFTYFLPGAPDPYAALCRFEHLVGELLLLPERGRWLDLLSSPRALERLARLLGTSDFIWEDLIRQQYEVLLPVLQRHVKGRRFSTPPERIEEKLRRFLKGAADLEAARRRLNEFKDREIFLIDLDHILRGSWRVTELAAALTALAEAVVRAAVDMVYRELVGRHGVPRTVAGLPARFAVFGLGKLGGAALGYASDIELLFVYSDSGKTDGPQQLENSEFFERLVRGVVDSIAAKREGIFRVDLRLRPYGLSGPWACSLKSFCEYYGPGGKAHAFERLALVRLRTVGGDREFGAQVERLRDQFVYESGKIDVEALRKLREKQLKEKVPPGRLNAKFGPGALVDLEYDVQLLQVKYGRENPRLRTPLLHEALRELAVAGVLEEGEAKRLTDAYFFLRRLINALRILRGSARDLFLPPVDSDEYMHLARRMGYTEQGGLSPAQRLYLDFETFTASVRAFVERHFGREFLPASAPGSLADLVLSEQVPAAEKRRILSKMGFADPDRAEVNIGNLAQRSKRPEQFARLIVLAGDYLSRSPDPDMALNNWDRFVKSQPEADLHYDLLLSQPRRLEILLSLFAGSQFLADTLIRESGFFEWLTDPRTLEKGRKREELLEELVELARKAPDRGSWLEQLRRFKRREMLRIGTKDMCLKAPVEEVTGELSALAEAAIQAALDQVWHYLQEEGRTVGWEEPERDFCVLAFGKLGGCELNYSSDVDLVGLCRPIGEESEVAVYRQVFDRAMERLRADLSDRTPEGYVYRVDLRLRAYGRAGHLVRTLQGLLSYYRNEASLWEIQALLKARPVAGNLELGHAFLGEVRELLTAKRDLREVSRAVRAMRRKREEQLRSSFPAGFDVKQDRGGIRDIEFLVQALQLANAWQDPGLLEGNTLKGVEELEKRGLLDRETACQLRENYKFLRRVEHYLQILEDRQTHVLPSSDQALQALAKRLLGHKARAQDLRERLGKIRAAVTETFERLLPE